MPMVCRTLVNQRIEFYMEIERNNVPSWLLVYQIMKDHTLKECENKKDLSISAAPVF